jgi:HSP20 family protein
MTKPRAPRLPVAIIVDGQVALGGHEAHALEPPVDVVEDERGWRLVFEIPGAVAEKTTIEVKNRVVVVRGVRRAIERGGGVFLRIERVAGPFERALELPEDADADHARAVYQDGLLFLDVPKRTSVRGRNIPIRRDAPEKK